MVVLTPAVLADYVCRRLRDDVAVCVCDAVSTGDALATAANLPASALRQLGVEWLLIPPSPSPNATDASVVARRARQAMEHGIGVVVGLRGQGMVTSMQEVVEKLVPDLQTSGRELVFAVDASTSSDGKEGSATKEEVHALHERLRAEAEARAGAAIAHRIRLVNLGMWTSAQAAEIMKSSAVDGVIVVQQTPVDQTQQAEEENLEGDSAGCVNGGVERRENGTRTE